MSEIQSYDIVVRILGLILILFVSVVLLIMIYETILSFCEMIIGRPILARFILFPKKLDSRSDILLNKYYPTYTKLKGRKRIVFASRVARFMKDKVFLIDKEVSDKQLVKVLISATAVKLTFGLRNYLFPSFHTISVRPRSYYSRYTKTNN